MKTHFLILAALLSDVFYVSADSETVVDPESGLTFSVNFSGRTVTSVDFYGGELPDDGVLRIPDIIQYNGQNIEVTGISKEMNTNNPSYKESLKELWIPESVKSIFSGLFAGYEELSDVNLEGVDSIGTNAFGNCAKLRNVSLPEGLTSIPDSCFMNCVSLTQITFPESLDVIGNMSFKDAGLNSVTIPGEVSLVDYAAFQGCPLTSVTIEGSNASPKEMNIGHYAFYTNTYTIQKVLCYRPVPPIMTGTGTSFSPATFKNAYLQLLGDAETHLAEYEADPYWSLFMSDDKPIYTSVDELKDDPYGGEYYVYDMNGVLRLKTTDSSLTGLQKGMYIVNGHKVII